jgi:putative ABC transport system substrate-binding protein
VRRREFITLLGAATAAWWPIAARAQQGERMRRIGVLVHGSQTGPIWRQRLAAFRQGLEVLGWQEGRNIKIETLFSDNDYDRLLQVAHTLVALNPEVIFANTTPATKALQRNSYYSDRIRPSVGPDRCRRRRQSGAARRQYYWLPALRG